MRDLPRIVGIGARAFPYINDPHSFFSERLRNCLVFVAEERGEIVGFVDVEVRGEEARIAGIAVDEEARGRGVGSALMSHALEVLGRLGVRRVTLQARVSNEPAVRMYRKFGFVRGRWVGEDVYEWYRDLR